MRDESEKIFVHVSVREPGIKAVFLSDVRAIIFVIFGLLHAINVMILCASLAFMLCYGCIPVCISCTYQENNYIMGVHVQRKIIDGVHCLSTNTRFRMLKN